jgi:hypothetical protein
MINSNSSNFEIDLWRENKEEQKNQDDYFGEVNKEVIKNEFKGDY